MNVTTRTDEEVTRIIVNAFSGMKYGQIPGIFPDERGSPFWLKPRQIQQLFGIDEETIDSKVGLGPVVMVVMTPPETSVKERLYHSMESVLGKGVTLRIYEETRTSYEPSFLKADEKVEPDNKLSPDVREAHSVKTEPQKPLPNEYWVTPEVASSHSGTNVSRIVRFAIENCINAKMGPYGKVPRSIDAVSLINYLKNTNQVGSAEKLTKYVTSRP